MPDTAFFVYIVLSIIAFGLQAPLVVGIARERDGLIAAAYRGGFLALTLLPMLLFSSWNELIKILPLILPLCVAAVTGALSYYFGLSAARFLPIGVHGALRQAAMASAAITIGMLLFSEFLTLSQFAAVSVVVLSSIALALTQKGSTFISTKTVGAGLRMSIMSGVLGAVSFYCFSVLSRAMHPFVATFFWESSIALCTISTLLILRATGRYRASPWLPSNDLLHIAAAGVLAMCASVSYAFAVNHGPFVLASGLFTTTVLIGIVTGRVVFKERLTGTQTLLITIAVMGIFTVKVVS